MSGFTCPRCGMTSHDPHDLEEGYCGNCHTWTAPPWGVPWGFIPGERGEEPVSPQVPE